MDGTDFATVKRGRSNSNSDADVIKIKEEIGRVDDADGSSEAEGSEDDDDGRGDERENYRRRERRQISHGGHLVEGQMKHGMEDFLVATCKKIDGHELGLYAIFDGHSRREVAEYLQDYLFDNILDESDFWTSPKTAVRRAYEETDKDILENVVGSRGGSTAVTAILIDVEKLVVANVGDSRAVVCRNGEAKQISMDHEPIKEKKKVESKGGFVSQKPSILGLPSIKLIV